MDELENCLELCEKLKRLLQQDIENISLSVTGEIYDAYVQSANEAVQITNEIKKQIKLLTVSYGR